MSLKSYFHYQNPIDRQKEGVHGNTINDRKATKTL